MWTLPLFGDRKPVPYLQTGFDVAGGQFSPDGKWIAYVSNESGKYEVYVRPFSESGGKLMVSTSGGSRPRWRRDGKEIFYLGDDGQLMAAKVRQNGSALAIDGVSPLFQTHTQAFLPSYDASADGQRFLMAAFIERDLPITLLLNRR